MDWILIVITAVVLDLIIGDPPNWPHPVRLIGFLIRRYEIFFRSIKFLPLKLGGFFLTALTLLTVVLILNSVLAIASRLNPVFYKIVSSYLLFTTIAARCLHIEAKKVSTALKEGELDKARKLLSYLVGRDTDRLDDAGVIRGVVETVAENTIDGVLAPLFYILIGTFFAIPVQMAFLYKTINTMDSMLGYLHEPYKEIGFASAKLDDLANYIPARIGSFLMLIAGIILGYDGSKGLQILLRDRRNHKSPNAAYSEAVVAGLLNIQLGGSNNYFGQKVYKPTIGDANLSVSLANITDTVKIMYLAEGLLITVFLTIYIFL